MEVTILNYYKGDRDIDIKVGSTVYIWIHTIENLHPK